MGNEQSANRLPPLENLSLQDKEQQQLGYQQKIPTLSFPTPAPDGPGTASLCQRCLTLLYHSITAFGNGSGLEGVSFPHSYFASSNDSRRDVNSSRCVICIKTKALFDGARQHVAFLEEERDTPTDEWTVTWRVSASNPKKPPEPELQVMLTATHGEGQGYGWGIGGFRVYPDHSLQTKDDNNTVDNIELASESPVVGLLDPTLPEEDFSSTWSSGPMEMVAKWMLECAQSHQKCHKILGTQNQGSHWFPDRLIKIGVVENGQLSKTGQPLMNIVARIVLKSDNYEFPPEKIAAGVIFCSLSHCWGPPPDASAPLGGRAEAVLTSSKLAAWKEDIPLDALPLTFGHAVKVAASLRFEYIWIDSLCIIQDSLQDWQEQSAVMGDVYKYAWMNIAAMSSTADDEGFINEDRDARIHYGFRCPFGTILGFHATSNSDDEQDYILLRGNAKLVWIESSYLPASNALNSPLLKRAWVYQERSLARRTLAFFQNSVQWACDGFSRHELLGNGGLETARLRYTLHEMEETAKTFATSSANSDASRQQVMFSMLQNADRHWYNTITAYSQCGLTKQTDKLIAISAIARELSVLLGKDRYVAGLWNLSLPTQLSWITVHGQSTPARKRAGEDGYVAPSWSWASIDAPVQPRFIYYPDKAVLPLADVVEAKSTPVTDFVFGAVSSGQLRMRGRLNSISGTFMADNGTGKRGWYLRDEATGESIQFISDTVEGLEYFQWMRHWPKLFWMPLTLSFGDMLMCTALILREVEYEESYRVDRVWHPFHPGDYCPGEQVYRRIGTGSFDRRPSMLKQDVLLMSLGRYPEVHIVNEESRPLRNFRRKMDDFREFLLV